MKKRILAMLLVATMVLSLIPMTVLATGKTYAIEDGTVDSNGSISFNKTVAEKGDTVLVTPSPNKGYQLKSLEYVHKLSAWSVCGDFTDSWTGDIYMAMTGDDVFVSPVLTLSEGALFKVRKDGDWFSENYGADDSSDPYTATVGTPIFSISNGKNIAVPTSGNYVVVLDLSTPSITLTSASTSVADPVAITPDSSGNYTFQMPEYPVTVTATFEEAPEHIHNLVMVAGQAATEETAGWKDYYECKDRDDACHEYFEDADGIVPIEDLTAWKEHGNGYIAPLGHKTNPESGDEKKATDESQTDKTAPVTEEAKASQTGDTSNIAIWFVLLALSSAGLCTCLIFNKKKKSER